MMRRKILFSLLLFLIIMISSNFKLKEPSLADNNIEISGANSAQGIKILPDKSSGFFIVTSDNVNFNFSYFNYISKEIYSYNSNYGPIEHNCSGALVSNSTLCIIDNTCDPVNIFPYLIEGKALAPDYITIGPSINLEENQVLEDTLAVLKLNSGPECEISIYNINPKDSSQVMVNIYNLFAQFPEKVISIKLNLAEDKLYAISETGKLYVSDINNSDFKTVEGLTLSAFKFLDDNLIISDDNKVYDISQENKATLICDMPFDSNQCLFKNYILYEDTDSTIKCFDRDTQNVTHTITLDGDIKALSSCKIDGENKAIALLEKDNKIFIHEVQEMDLKVIEKEPDTPTPDKPDDPIVDPDIKDPDDPGKDPNIKDPDDQNKDPEDEDPNDPKIDDNNQDLISGEITSNIYNIDKTNHFILGVQAGTTIANFKKNVSFDENYTLKFKNYLDKDIKSGKLGTGSSVRFYLGEDLIYEFKIVVFGDLTGEGNINSRDVNVLYKYLFNEIELENEYLIAADINQDGVVNTLDLLLLTRMIGS